MKTHTEYITSISPEMAQSTVRNYVCSMCYGQLVEYLTDEGAIVKCANCGDNTKGYVSKRYAERRQQESLAEKIEARQVLKNIIPSPNQGKTEAQMLKELGF